MNEQPSWQQLETESLLQLLDTNMQRLSSLAATRLKQYGPNRIEERKRVGKFCQAVRSIFSHRAVKGAAVGAKAD